MTQEVRKTVRHIASQTTFVKVGNFSEPPQSPATGVSEVFQKTVGSLEEVSQSPAGKFEELSQSLDSRLAAAGPVQAAGNDRHCAAMGKAFSVALSEQTEQQTVTGETSSPRTCRAEKMLQLAVKVCSDETGRYTPVERKMLVGELRQGFVTLTQEHKASVFPTKLSIFPTCKNLSRNRKAF